MQLLLKRLLASPLILLPIVALLVVLCLVLTLLRPGASADGTNASFTDRIGSIFSGLRPRPAGPAQSGADVGAGAQAAAPTQNPAVGQPAQPAPTAAAPAPTQPPPPPPPTPAPTQPVVVPITPVPPVNTEGNVIAGNGGGVVVNNNTGTNNTGNAGAGTTGTTVGGEAGGVQCGTRLYHTVRAGENLFRIGLRYNTTATAIARLNRITNVRAVSVGRRLVIVACARGSGGSGAYFSSRSGTYVVRPGDTLFRIALRFGVNVQYLCRVNGLYTSLIVPGQTLVIP